ncbi:MAG: formate dehydrogenase accessory sulfurtransferase FdhD [Actinomycetota bacterium]|nr:formate dehydrogenase accessory sulfurtransferase FdhD [Actinomycetota bacterium]
MIEITTLKQPSVRRPTTDVKIAAVRDGYVSTRPDVLATEEPMEIRVHGPNQEPTPVTVTMRTPGNDFELAIGLLYSEGLIDTHGSLKTVCYCTNVSNENQRFNVVTVELTSQFIGNQRARSFMSSSACGVCGTTSIEDLAGRSAVVESQMKLDITTVFSLPKLLMKGQKLFKLTGGLHGAGIFDESGRLEVVREDIGRHNALDKIVGHYFLEEKLPLSNKVLVLSGRIGFELVQKAAMAQIPVVVAVSAPSSLAVQTADSLGITMIGFTRDNNANIYSHPERIRFNQ